MTVSEWADEYRIIGAANAEAGKWRTDRAPYQREPMNCMCDPKVERITLMWGAQLGKTELINNGIGYHIHQNPVSQMMMHPTQGDLKTWLETKLNPLISETPEISERVAKPRSREGVNNDRMKSYAGGFLMFSWSGSPNTMRGRSAPRILCDEVDGYETTGEGDPINLLWQRAATFGDQRQLVITSTPTIKGFSRVERSYEMGDQRQFYLPCPHCGEHQTLKWGQVHWHKDEDGEPLPETAVYICEHCDCVIKDKNKMAMLRQGEWRAEKPFRGHASFHLNELYSPFRKFRDIVQSFLEKKASGDLQSFVNVSLAETWEEQGSSIDHSALFIRREHYTDVPEKAVVLTCAVDVQDDRLEMQVEAWGEGEENWKLDFQVFRGDPAKAELWRRLDEALQKKYDHVSGVKLPISCTAIDSGGHYTEQVYKFVKPREVNRVYAIKGSSKAGGSIVSRPTKSNLGKVNLFSIATDTAKEQIYGRLGITEPGSGYIHFPIQELFDEEWFLQLTSEKCVTRYKEGREYRKWVKTRPRNEALDLSVYNLAALYILNPNYESLGKRLNEQVFENSKPKPDREKQNQQQPVNTWLNNGGSSWL